MQTRLLEAVDGALKLSAPFLAGDPGRLPGRMIASWGPDFGTGFEAFCTVPADAALIVYGDSAGGVHVLRLLE